MRNTSQVMIGLLALGFLSVLQAQHVVVVADSSGVSVEAEISYEDHRRFSDDEVQPVFRVYMHGSDSVFVDVPTTVNEAYSSNYAKKVRGQTPQRLKSVGVVELLTSATGQRKTNNFAVKENRKLSFKDLQIVGLDITFINDPSIRAHVVNDKEVEFEGKKWRLSTLTREIQTRKGKTNVSGSYNGSIWWEFDGTTLADLM